MDAHRVSFFRKHGLEHPGHIVVIGQAVAHEQYMRGVLLAIETE